MSASFRQFFRGIHRPVRLPQLRLGRDWEIEVRALSLSAQPSKGVHIKIKYRTSDSTYGPEHPLLPGDF